MRFFFFYYFYVILLLCIFSEYSLAINDTDLIQCTSCPQITVSFEKPLVFPEECQENSKLDALACGIEYKINYDTKEITIDFLATNDTGSLEDQKPSEFIVQTVWLSLSHNITDKNLIIRKYGCNTNNDCAKQSYINIINYFVTEGIIQLDLIKNKLQNDSLIVGEESRRRCIDSTKTSGRPSRKCPTGLCYFNTERFNLNDEQSFKEQRCEHENRPYLFSEFERHTPPSQQKEREILKYQCNKNVCNRHDFADRIKTQLADYTNGISRIQGDKSISGKNGGLTLQQTLSTSSIVVLSLVLIQLFI